MPSTMAWGLDLVLGIMLAIVGFFVKQIVNDQKTRAEQISNLSERIVALEERERGLGLQITEVKSTLDGLVSDIRFVREEIVGLTSRGQSER